MQFWDFRSLYNQKPMISNMKMKCHTNTHTHSSLFFHYFCFDWIWKIHLKIELKQMLLWMNWVNCFLKNHCKVTSSVLITFHRMPFFKSGRKPSIKIKFIWRNKCTKVKFFLPKNAQYLSTYLHKSKFNSKIAFLISQTVHLSQIQNERKKNPHSIDSIHREQNTNCS